MTDATATADAAVPVPVEQIPDAELTPMQRAKALVQLERRRKNMKFELTIIEKTIAKHKTAIAQLMEDEELSTKFLADGATVFTREEVWASPAPDEAGNADHAKLAGVLDALGLHELTPKNVNSQSLSAHVRERLEAVPALNEETGELLTFEERLDRALPKALRECLKVSNPSKVVVTGA